jgi:hypothetical protein
MLENKNGVIMERSSAPNLSIQLTALRAAADADRWVSQEPTMDDRSELHWRYLKDNLDHSRHHETLRATSSNIILVVAGAAFTVVGYDKSVAASDLPILIFVFALGIFGALFAAKQTERASLHYQRARALREALDQGPHAPDFKGLKAAADAKHNPKYPWLSARELRRFWMALHLLVSLLAAALIVVWFNTPACPK